MLFQDRKDQKIKELEEQIKELKQINNTLRKAKNAYEALLFKRFNEK